MLNASQSSNRAGSPGGIDLRSWRFRAANQGRRGTGLDVDIYLLAHVEHFPVRFFQVEDDLEDAGIDAFGAIAG